MRPSQHKRKPTTPTNDHEEERVLERRQDHGRNGHRRCHRRCKCQNRTAPAGLDQFRAARQGDLFALRQILGTQESGDANKQNSWTALHFACEKGHLHIVEYLVGENHWNANAPDHQKRTPLHIAAAHGHVRVVRYLVGGSYVYMDAVDGWGNTALHLACKNFHVPVVRCLLQHETPQEPCLLHKRNRYVETALWMLSRAPSSNAATKRWRKWACDSESDDESESEEEANIEEGRTNNNNTDEDEEESCSPAELVELVERLYVIPYEMALLSPDRTTATPPWNIVLEHKFPFGREAQAALSRQLATFLAPPPEDYREAKKFVVAMRRYAWFTKGHSNETTTTTTTTNTPPQNLRMGFRLENNDTITEDNLVGDWGRL